MNVEQLCWPTVAGIRGRIPSTKVLCWQWCMEQYGTKNVRLMREQGCSVPRSTLYAWKRAFRTYVTGEESDGRRCRDELTTQRRRRVA